jgi:hypothetical protein
MSMRQVSNNLDSSTNKFRFTSPRRRPTMPGMCRFLLLFALALIVAACGEKPPRADPDPGYAYNDQPLPTPMRDRTLRQGGLR